MKKKMVVKKSKVVKEKTSCFFTNPYENIKAKRGLLPNIIEPRVE
jgi:hypothetical protein